MKPRVWDITDVPLDEEDVQVAKELVRRETSVHGLSRVQSSGGLSRGQSSGSVLSPAPAAAPAATPDKKGADAAPAAAASPSKIGAEDDLVFRRLKARANMDPNVLLGIQESDASKAIGERSFKPPPKPATGARW